MIKNKNVRKIINTKQFHLEPWQYQYDTQQTNQIDIDLHISNPQHNRMASQPKQLNHHEQLAVSNLSGISVINQNDNTNRNTIKSSNDNKHEEQSIKQMRSKQKSMTPRETINKSSDQNRRRFSAKSSNVDYLKRNQQNIQLYSRKFSISESSISDNFNFTPINQPLRSPIKRPIINTTYIGYFDQSPVFDRFQNHNKFGCRRYQTQPQIIQNKTKIYSSVGNSKQFSRPMTTGGSGVQCQNIKTKQQKRTRISHFQKVLKMKQRLRLKIKSKQPLKNMNSIQKQQIIEEYNNNTISCDQLMLETFKGQSQQYLTEPKTKLKSNKGLKNHQKIQLSPRQKHQSKKKRQKIMRNKKAYPTATTCAKKITLGQYAQKYYKNAIQLLQPGAGFYIEGRHLFC